MNCELEAALRQAVVSVRYDHGTLFIKDDDDDYEYNYKLDVHGYFRLDNHNNHRGDKAATIDGGILYSTLNCKLFLKKGKVVLASLQDQLVICESAKFACCTRDYLVVVVGVKRNKKGNLLHVFDIYTLDLLLTTTNLECNALEAIGFNVIKIGSNSFVNIKRQK